MKHLFHSRIFQTLVILSPLLIGGRAQAVGLDDAQTNLQNAGGAAYGEDVAGLQGTEGYLPLLIGKIVGIALMVIGGVLVLLLVYGGYYWMTARGDAEKVKKAKDIIINAIIGLIIVMAAYATASFVVNQISGATRLQ